MNTKQQTLFQRDFTLVVIGQVISLFGNAIVRFALPLYLLRATGSSSLFGAVTAAAFLPMILFSLVGGVLADRVNKRNIMVALDFGTAGLILTFYLLHGQVPIVPLMIVCLMLLYGISGAYQPAVQASIPALLPREQITRGNAVINMVSTLSGLLGPVLGGILFGLWGIGPILLLSILCFACSAVMELFIHIPGGSKRADVGVLRVVGGDLSESWRYIRTQRPIFLRVMAMLALLNFVLSAAMIVGIPVIVVQILGLSDTHLGVTQGALGLGGLTGGLLVGMLGSRLKIRHGGPALALCALAVAVMGLGLLPQVSGPGAYLLITAMGFAAMAAATVFQVLTCSAIQRQTPAHLVGKVMALAMAVANCASPLGQTLYGILFDLCREAPWAVMLGAAALALATVLLFGGVFMCLEREESRHTVQENGQGCAQEG